MMATLRRSMRRLFGFSTGLFVRYRSAGRMPAERLRAKFRGCGREESKPGRHDRARLNLLRRLYSRKSLKNNDFVPPLTPVVLRWPCVSAALEGRRGPDAGPARHRHQQWSKSAKADFDRPLILRGLLRSPQDNG